MLKLVYILAIFLCGVSYAGECNGSCPAPGVAPQNDWANQLFAAAALDGANAASQDGKAKNAEEIRDAKRKENSDVLQPQIDVVRNKMTSANPEELPALQAELAALEKKQEENERKAKEQDALAKKHRAEQAQALKDMADKIAKANSLGAQQASGGGSGGGGMPMMPPPPGGGDKGGDDKGGGNNDLKPAPVQTPQPMPSPTALANNNSTQVLSDAEFKKALEAAGQSKLPTSSKTDQAIASLTQQNADLAKQVAETQQAASAARAQASLNEMQQYASTRTSPSAKSSSTSGGGSKNGSPFDLSTRQNDTPSMVATKSTPTASPAKATPKQQASAQLIAAATGSSSASSNELEISSVSNGLTRKAVARKPASSGPVYGMRSSSTRVATYSNMTVPKALQSTMNSRIAIVGGSTPKNHQPPQMVVEAPRPAYTADPNARLRGATGVSSAHVAR